MTDIKVEWFQSGDDLAEIYQNTQMQFSFLSPEKDGNKQCHLFVLCRDFLHDAVRAYITKGSCNIYGFRYNYKTNPPISMGSMRMLVTKKGLSGAKNVTDFSKYMECAVSLLNHYEKMVKWKKSHCKKVIDDKKHVWLFTGSSMWVSSPFLISMYSFLIRLATNENIISGFKDNDDLMNKYKILLNNGTTGNDITYLKDCWDKMHLVLKASKKLFFLGEDKLDGVYFDGQPINNFHNYNGIYNLCKNKSSKKDITKIIEA